MFASDAGGAVIGRLRRWRRKGGARLPATAATGDALAGGRELPAELVAAKRSYMKTRRTFTGGDWEKLTELLRLADVVVGTGEAAAMEQRPARLIALRHDIDHDLENAVRTARLEAEAGFRSTYFALHTDWYYRTPAGASTLVLRALDEIASMGHEIGLHNNAITAALLTGGNPVRILAGHLEDLRAHGFDVRGTVAHGDPLCRVAGYVNSEVFHECPRPALGPPDRVISYVDETDRERSVRLCSVPMADLGLDYEAGFIGHRLYLSDTGGRWSRPMEEVGERFAGEGGFLQVLIHPIWWSFDADDVVRARPPRSADITMVKR